MVYGTEKIGDIKRSDIDTMFNTSEFTTSPILSRGPTTLLTFPIYLPIASFRRTRSPRNHPINRQPYVTSLERSIRKKLNPDLAGMLIADFKTQGSGHIINLGSVAGREACSFRSFLLQFPQKSPSETC